jgi:hypothetical protein
VFALRSFAQETVSLNDLSFWKPTGKANWQIAGDVTADLTKNETMTTQAGKGILVNLPDANNRANLLSAAEYGDVDVEFDFMMASHSNSGFYLQGRYEIQLLDSWGVKNLLMVIAVVFISVASLFHKNTFTKDMHHVSMLV